MKPKEPVGLKPMYSSAPETTKPCSTYGYCTLCDTTHILGEGNARSHCYDLMKILDTEKRIDFVNTIKDPKFSTDYLFGPARGQMFGILECSKSNGDIVILKAFSCQYDGEWECEGWCPPLLDTDQFYTVLPTRDAEIKATGAQINQLEKHDPARRELVQTRKQLSQQFMRDIHNMYTVHNFEGHVKSLHESYIGTGGIPTGCGDCCAPKLLNHAAQLRLKPLGLAEFYWGKENQSGSKQHAVFYSCCEEKCQPILGYMLCGVKND